MTTFSANPELESEIDSDNDDSDRHSLVEDDSTDVTEVLVCSKCGVKCAKGFLESIEYITCTE
ncbi:MAG: hypothetical protein J07AB43_00480 [Candidatus Nanosalina sp. J07AB43]|nr:MAG: hypothetical protein J07AB43_00480 [Candidatus Nanosalina sp. J07AB43]